MQLAITIICALIIILTSVQLYRTLSWQRLISRKQAEFGNFKIKNSTKPYYAGLATSFVVMVMVNITLPSQLSMSKGVEENASEESQVMMMEMAPEENAVAKEADGESYDSKMLENSAVASSTTATEDSLSGEMVLSDRLEMLNNFIADEKAFTYDIKKVNETANDYSDEEILGFFRNKELSYSYEEINDCDYELTLTSKDETDVEVYTIKEFETYFVVCDNEYKECYYVYK